MHLFATGFIHKLPLYVAPVPDNQAFAIEALSINWNNLHAYACPPTGLIPPVPTKIHQSRSRIIFIAPLAATFLVLKGVTATSISPNSTSILSKLTNTSNGMFQHQNLLTPAFYTWELSRNQLEIKIFCKTLLILSQDHEEHLIRSMVQKWVIYSIWCRRKVNPFTASLTVIADFLIYLFLLRKISDKYYQGL